LLGTQVSDSYQQAFLLAYGAGTKYGRELPHDRKQESEADHIGLIYMARAGYDPAAAVAFWERFSAHNNEMSGGKKASFLSGFASTHPVDADRIAALKKLLPEAQAEFAKSKVH